MDRYYAIESRFKRFFPNTDFIQVESFDDIINNNPIEAFNGQFKAGTNPKEGLSLLILQIFWFPFLFSFTTLSDLILHWTILLRSSGWCYVQW